MTTLTDRFTRAVDYARIAHAAQVRKGTTVPYLTHLLGVAALVIEFGGTEDQAIAGLLHDTIEDCGQAHAAIIRAQFGDAVADIVEGCTDGTAEGKDSLRDQEAKRQDWLRRKHVYLAHLAHADAGTQLVSACDKLHNARAINQDLGNPTVGLKVFDRFKGGRVGTLGYYESLARAFAAQGAAPAAALDAEVARMHVLAGEAHRHPLSSASPDLSSEDDRISRRFWFEHESGARLYPYKLLDRRGGRVAFRVAPGAKGANKTENQTQLDDVEQVFQHVFVKGWSVRMRSLDGSYEGLYNKDGYSIVRTSES
jgi:hypothetical protein